MNLIAILEQEEIARLTAARPCLLLLLATPSS